MEIKDINEIRAAIKYMDYKPTFLSKFYDVKSLLFKEIVENPEYYKVESILPNPLNDNKIVKCINILDAKYTKHLEKLDYTKDTAKVPEEAAEILNNVTVKTENGIVSIDFDSDVKADVYINIPRGNALTINNMSLKNAEFEVMNVFNTYVSEGFTLACRMENMSISIEPSALDGIKGQGDCFVYVMTKNIIYKDLASKYFDPSAVLTLYRG